MSSLPAKRAIKKPTVLSDYEDTLFDAKVSSDGGLGVTSQLEGPGQRMHGPPGCGRRIFRLD